MLLLLLLVLGLLLWLGLLLILGLALLLLLGWGLCFFALFALTNFQILQAMHYSAVSSGGLDDDEDWWKR